MFPGALVTLTFGDAPFPKLVTTFRTGVVWSTPVKLTDPASRDALPPLRVTWTACVPDAGAFRENNWT
jgi:hypothetical protein